MKKIFKIQIDLWNFNFIDVYYLEKFANPKYVAW